MCHFLHCVSAEEPAVSRAFVGSEFNRGAKNEMRTECDSAEEPGSSRALVGSEFNRGAKNEMRTECDSAEQPGSSRALVGSEFNRGAKNEMRTECDSAEEPGSSRALVGSEFNRGAKNEMRTECDSAEQPGNSRALVSSEFNRGAKKEMRTECGSAEQARFFKAFIQSEFDRCLQKMIDRELTEAVVMEKLIQSTLTTPKYTSRVLLTPKGKHFDVRTRAGFGKSQKWTDEKSNKFNLWVFRVETTVLAEKRGECTPDQVQNATEIAEEIVSTAIVGEKTQNNSIPTVLTETVKRLNKAKLYWILIEIGENGDKNDICGLCKWTDSSNISCVYAEGKLKTFKFGLRIYLPKYEPTE